MCFCVNFKLDLRWCKGQCSTLNTSLPHYLHPWNTGLWIYFAILNLKPSTTHATLLARHSWREAAFVRTHLITKCWKVANSVQTLARRFMLRRSAVSASSKRLPHNTNTKLTVKKSATTILPNSAKFWADASYAATEISAGTTRKSACYRAIQTHKYNVEREQERGEHARTNWYKDKNRDKKGERLFETWWIVTHTYHPFEPGLQHMRVLHLIWWYSWWKTPTQSLPQLSFPECS